MLQIPDTRFQHFSSFAGKLVVKLTMKMPHDSHGASLEYTADQLVRVAFQLQVEGAFDTMGTVVLDHDSEDRQHTFGRTRDCRGAS